MTTIIECALKDIHKLVLVYRFKKCCFIILFNVIDNYFCWKLTMDTSNIQVIAQSYTELHKARILTLILVECCVVKDLIHADTYH